MHVQSSAAQAKWRMISQTAEYAMRAVLHLATRPADEPTSAADAAALLRVPERYLARVLNTLAHEGILVSARGAQGGYRLAESPGELTLAAVVAPFDAVGDPPQCLLRDQRCGKGEPCIAHERWHSAAAGVRTFFKTTTIADLLAAAAAAPEAKDLLKPMRSQTNEERYRPDGHDGQRCHPPVSALD